MWYRMSMAHVDPSEAQRLYVESLRWRSGDLLAKLQALVSQIASLTRDETELRQQLRAVEQLLAAEGASPTDSKGSIGHVGKNTNGSVSATGNGKETDGGSLDFSSWGPKARGIYVAAAQAIADAAIPLHYRVLAAEVQKNVPLSGVDPGATLIAHLHRAQHIFPRVGRGVYGLQGMGTAAATVKAPGSTPVRRRRKTRRRTR
jgi:hypothetical protein